MTGAHPRRLCKAPWRDVPAVVRFGIGHHRYGILNTTVRETNQQNYGIPFPGTFLLNTHGVVTSRFFESAYQERSTVGSIMARLGNTVEVQATTVSPSQLELTSFATDSTVAPGTQFSLVLDVRPVPLRVSAAADRSDGVGPVAIIMMSSTAMDQTPGIVAPS